MLRDSAVGIWPALTHERMSIESSNKKRCPLDIQTPREGVFGPQKILPKTLQEASGCLGMVVRLIHLEMFVFFGDGSRLM